MLVSDSLPELPNSYRYGKGDDFAGGASARERLDARMSQRHGGRTRPSRTIPSTSISPQFIRAALLLLAAIALVGLVVFGVTRCVSGSAASTGQDASASSAVDTVAARVSFVAVGDNLPNDVIGEYADSQAGSKGDGSYDYRFLFTQVKPIVSSVDLAYVDQETHIGGDDIGPKGYPSFNTTDEMADAVVDAGFDMVASATNHAYDWGYYGALEHSLDVWSKLPVAYAGTAASAEAAEKVAVVERSGIRFALLSYTYGLNGYQEGEIEDYYVNYIDKGKISADVARAKGVADVVLVAMHWGTEDESNPDAMEQEYAQFLADVGVDVVLGSHPHIIQPMTWLSGKDGNRTLVCYSLGNFVMQYEDPTPHQNLEGMMKCDFVRRQAEGPVTVENVEWVPLVYHGAEGEYSVWPVSSYPDAFASRHTAFKGESDPKSWMVQESNRIVNSLGGSFPIEGMGASPEEEDGQ